MALVTFDFTVAQAGQVCVTAGRGTYQIRRVVTGGSIPYQSDNEYFTVGSNNNCAQVLEAGDYLIQYDDSQCCGNEVPAFEYTENAALLGGGGGAADGNDVSTLTDNNDGTFTHAAGGVTSTIDVGAAVLVAIAANPDAFVAALAAATNLINIDDLAGTTTHKAFPA